ncbi:MAG TPA: hypothetical protein VG734_13445 [Lacunisphaera sp.]|nr:hypothetical protein [Lacunisphaera sp.]
MRSAHAPTLRSSRRTKSFRHPRGSVIVLVLGLVTLGAFLIGQFIERSVTEMLVESRVVQAARLRVEARSALEASLAVLADYQVLDGGLRAPVQGWGEPLAGMNLRPREGLKVRVAVEDESGLVSLPRLGANDLIALGKRFGLKEAEAARLADAILTWTHRDHSTTRLETSLRNYELANPPHRPPGRPMASFDELAAIAGAREFFFTAEGQATLLYADFVRNVSLYDFPAPNLNSARPATLALAGLDDSQAARVIAYRDARGPRAPGTPPYFRSLEEAKSLLGLTVPIGRFDTLARCLRVQVTVQEGGSSFHLTVVVAPTGVDAPASQGAPAVGEKTTDLSLSDATQLHYPFKLLAYEETMESAPPPS